MAQATRNLTEQEVLNALYDEGIDAFIGGLPPRRAALARTVDASVDATTEITLNAATKFIRVYAIAKDLYLKYGTADATAANFDEVIPAGQICDFYLPDSTAAINLIGREAGATAIVIEK